MRGGVTPGTELLSSDSACATTQDGSLTADLDPAVGETNELESIRPFGDVVAAAVLVCLRHSEVQPIHEGKSMTAGLRHSAAPDTNGDVIAVIWAG